VYEVPLLQYDDASSPPRVGSHGPLTAPTRHPRVHRPVASMHGTPEVHGRMPTAVHAPQRALMCHSNLARVGQPSAGACRVDERYPNDHSKPLASAQLVPVLCSGGAAQVTRLAASAHTGGVPCAAAPRAQRRRAGRRHRRHLRLPLAGARAAARHAQPLAAAAARRRAAAVQRLPAAAAAERLAAAVDADERGLGRGRAVLRGGGDADRGRARHAGAPLAACGAGRPAQAQPRRDRAAERAAGGAHGVRARCASLSLDLVCPRLRRRRATPLWFTDGALLGAPWDDWRVCAAHEPDTRHARSFAGTGYVRLLSLRAVFNVGRLAAMLSMFHVQQRASTIQLPTLPKRLVARALMPVFGDSMEIGPQTETPGVCVCVNPTC
jgi:hypothetical protein